MKKISVPLWGFCFLYLRNLSLTYEELEDRIDYKSNISKENKLKLLQSGWFGQNIQMIIPNFKLSETVSLSDYEYLEFLADFRYATMSTFLTMSNKKEYMVRGQIDRLNREGVIDEMLLFGTRIYGLSRIGKALIQDNNSKKYITVGRKSLPTLSALATILAVNHVGACLYKNSVNALDLPDFPYKGREFLGHIVEGETMVTEWKIRRSLQLKTMELTGNLPFVKYVNSVDKSKNVRNIIGSEYNKIWKAWDNGLFGFSKEISPEMLDGNEWLYILFPDMMGSDMSYCIPDLVVKRPRDENGKPHNIAIEIEKTTNRQKLLRKLQYYKNDKRVYEKVVYITHTSSIANMINEVAKSIGLESDRYNIMTFLVKRGSSFRPGKIKESLFL